MTLTYVTKTRYKDGVAHGYSSVHYEDGETFKGMLKKGIKQGLGESKTEEGSVYRG